MSSACSLADWSFGCQIQKILCILKFQKRIFLNSRSRTGLLIRFVLRLGPDISYLCFMFFYLINMVMHSLIRLLVLTCNVFYFYASVILCNHCRLSSVFLLMVFNNLKNYDFSSMFSVQSNKKSYLTDTCSKVKKLFLKWFCQNNAVLKCDVCIMFSQKTVNASVNIVNIVMHMWY